MPRRLLNRLLLVLLLCLAQVAVVAVWHPHVVPSKVAGAGLESGGEHHEEVVAETVPAAVPCPQLWGQEDRRTPPGPHPEEILHVPRVG